MTPEEKTIVRMLVAVAWVDGEMQAPESGVIDGLLAGFDASKQETDEILEFAKTPRTLRDVDVSGLSSDHKDTLLRNAVLLVCADGVETDVERGLLAQLALILELSEVEAQEVVRSVRRGIGAATRHQGEDLDPAPNRC
jgi:tellurite resistance protein